MDVVEGVQDTVMKEKCQMYPEFTAQMKHDT